MLLEQITYRYAEGRPEWNVILLRYFNRWELASGLIREDRRIPNNPDTYITQSCHRKVERGRRIRKRYTIHTGQNRCPAAYIHAMDLAEGHVKSIKKRG